MKFIVLKHLTEFGFKMVLVFLPCFIHLTVRNACFCCLKLEGGRRRLICFLLRIGLRSWLLTISFKWPFFQGLWPHLVEATLAAFHPYGKQLVSWCDQAWYSPSSSSCTCRTLFCYRKQSYCKQFLYLSLYSPQCWECYVVQCQTKCIFPLSWPSSSELLYALEIWAAFSCGVW